MHKKLFSLLTAFILLSCTSYITFAYNSPQDTISANKIKFQQLNNKILETNLEISKLNIQLDKLNNTIKQNVLDINEIEKQIKAAQLNMDQLSTEIDSNQKIADKRLRAMYMISPNGNYLSIVLTSKNFSDFLFKWEAIKKITSFDKKLLKELEIKKVELNKNIADLDIKNQQLQQIKSSNTANLQELNAHKRQLESLVKQFDLEKKAAAIIIEENEEKLVAYSISVINSQTSSINDMEAALSTLKSLLTQLNTPSVKNKAEKSIEAGSKKLITMKANNALLNNVTASNSASYKATFTMVATAYTAYSDKALTAMGLKPVRDPNGLSTIAVDPSVIPLGTKVYIPGYGYAICSDTGGAIKGNKIDLYLNSVAECFEWGIRNVTLHVVAYPGEW